jgi:hypothetical protein
MYVIDIQFANEYFEISGLIDILEAKNR